MQPRQPLFSVLDHLVYATPDLDAAVAEIEGRLGVRAAVGGQHKAWGTRNALISLGPRMYLELFGPDPTLPAPAARPFGLDTLTRARLVSWVARAQDLAAAVQAAAAEGVDLGEVQQRSRQRPDGSVLSWTMTDPTKPRADGIVPYFIHWGDSPHPAASAPAGCTLLALRVSHPEAARLHRVFQALGLDLSVEPGPGPLLEATIRSPVGDVVLS